MMTSYQYRFIEDELARRLLVSPEEMKHRLWPIVVQAEIEIISARSFLIKAGEWDFLDKQLETWFGGKGKPQ